MDACSSSLTISKSAPALWLLFFFQAEDGIRDTSVTGVQTCALPIWSAPALRVSPGIWLSYLVPDQRRHRAAGERAYPLAGPRLDEGDRQSLTGAVAGGPRSEERRVGKECRVRWGGDDLQKRSSVDR